MKNLQLILGIIVTLFLASCGGAQQSKESVVMSGKVQIDGSSTVYPITEAIAEEFRAVQPEIRVTIGISGTGGGFKKFSRGETDINNASRPIKEKEVAVCQENKINYQELRIAFDGLAVVVNPENTWVDYLTTAELKKMWEPAAQGTITKWSQIREGWPEEDFKLYGPGVASGTYDYFTEVIVGESGSSRGDYMASEDDNVLVQGIAGDKNAIGFFGLSYYQENAALLKLAPVDNGSGPIQPTVTTIMDGTYAPLSRPIFIYVSDLAVARPEVAEFVKYYLTTAGALVGDVGYIPLSAEEYQGELSKLAAFVAPK